jgi:hypothetical protein
MSLDWKDVSIENQNKIYNLIIAHTKENHCCRVGWACKQIMLTTVQENVLDKIAARVVSDGKFIKESANVNFKYDWNITYNPYRNQFRRGVITTLIGVTIGFFLTTGKEMAKELLPSKHQIDTVVVKEFISQVDTTSKK